MTPQTLAASALALLCATPVWATDRTAVLVTYTNIAEAKYQDSLTAARALKVAINALVSKPSPASLAAARDAWLVARIPYQQTEVYRFGNPIVDDWEGKVNAWPLDEGLIDYVDASYAGPTDENIYAALNVIATPKFELAGAEIDATTIAPALLSNTLHEADGVDVNVAAGYHAIEFLLWGQDLNGTGPGAGNRPWTDYAQGTDCTNGNCDRRAAYLQAATDLLVDDLEWMAAQWAQGGAARASVMADETAGLIAIVTGMGSLSYGELAGERMRLGLLLNDPEEEQDCFSDNTHNSHYYDGLGIQNVYLGRYQRLDGETIAGPSLSDLVAEADPVLDTELRAKLDTTIAALEAIRMAARSGMAYDQMLARGNAKGEALIMAGIEGLIDQTRSIQRLVPALGLDAISFEGSDSLDNPGAVFQ